MNFVVLDTSIASITLDDRPQLARYEAYLRNSLPVVSFQTIAEMRFGALLKGWGVLRRERLETFLGSLLVQEYNDGLANAWAQVMHEARRAGRRLEAGDAWIAATALLLNAPLLTHDKDFDAQACPSITIIRYTDANQTS